MDVLKELFNFKQIKDFEKEIYCVPDLNFGSRSSAASAKNIALRTVLGESTATASTINTAMLFLDAVCEFNNLNFLVAENINCVYGEFIDSDTETFYRFHVVGNSNKSITVSYEDDNIDNYNKIIPYIAYIVSTNDQAKEAFLSFLKDKNKLTAYEFCDTIYYLTKANNPNIEIRKDSLIVETIQQAIDNGTFEVPNEFKDLGFTFSINVNAKTESKVGNNQTLFYEDIKKGKMIIDYDWDDEVKNNIPPLSSLNSFVPTETFINILSKIKYRFEKVIKNLNDGIEDENILGKDYINAFLLGKPGTGKTKTIFALGAALGIPVYSVPLSKNTEEDVFQGMNKIIDGKLAFVQTDTIRAFEHGGLIVFEEINLADPAVVMGSLGQAIEFPYNIHKNGYEPIKRHPLLAVFGTMNIGTYGSKGVNQALSSRFKQSFILNETPKEEMINILKHSLSDKSSISSDDSFSFSCNVPSKITNDDIEWVYDVYEMLVSYLKDDGNDDLLINLSTRSCIGVLELIEEGVNPFDAIRAGFVGKIAENDLELAEEISTKLKNTVNVKKILRRF